MNDTLEILGQEKWWQTVPIADGETGVPFWLLAIALVAVVLLVFFFTKLILAKNTQAQKVHEQVDAIRYLVAKNNKRIQLVEKHAVNYYHSMGAGATNALVFAKEILSALDSLCNEIDTLVASEDFDALLAAEQMLDAKLDLSQDTLHSVQMNEGKPPDLYRQDWSRKLDELLETIGRDISKASDAAHRMNLNKLDSKQTYLDLIEAGLRVVLEKGRRITNTFRSPFHTEFLPNKDDSDPENRS